MKLFERKKISININDSSIEILEISFASGHPVVTNSSRSILEEGVVVSGKIKDRKKMVKILAQMFQNGDNGIFEKNLINFVVQENNLEAYLFQIKSNDETRKKIQLELNKRLLGAIEEYSYHYKHLNQIESLEEDGIALVSLVAIRNDFMVSWSDLFSEIGYKTEYFVPGYTLFPNFYSTEQRNILFINLNLNNSSLSIFLDNQLFRLNKIDFKELISDNFKNTNFKKTSLDKFLNRDILYLIILEIEKLISSTKKITDRSIKTVYLYGDLSKDKTLKHFLEKEFDNHKINIEEVDKEKIEKEIKTKSILNYFLAINDCSENNYCFSIPQKKFRNFLNKKNILIGVFLFLFLIFSISTSYFVKSFFRKSSAPSYSEKKYLLEDLFKYKIFLSTEEIKRDNQINGRLFEINLTQAEDFDDILKNAYKILQKETKNDEFYWKEPLVTINEGDNLIFSLKTTWFIGKKKDLNEIVYEKIEKKLEGNSYELEVLKNSLIKSDIYEGLYSTDLEINLMHNFDINNYNLKEEELNRIIIVNTDDRMVNIRKGPGTKFPIIAKARKGEAYKYVRTLNSWANIILSNGKRAWVSSKFVKILN